MEETRKDVQVESSPVQEEQEKLKSVQRAGRSGEIHERFYQSGRSVSGTDLQCEKISSIRRHFHDTESL